MVDRSTNTGPVALVGGPRPERPGVLLSAAAAVLTQNGHGGQIYPMTGPETLTRVAQLDAIGAAVGRELTFTENTPEEFRADMSRYGVPEEIVTMLLDYWRDTVDEPDVVRSPERLTGRPARALAEWARDHAADFGAPHAV